MENFENKLIVLEKNLKIFGGIFEDNSIQSKLKDIESSLLNENFWKDKNKVKKIVQEKKRTKTF